MSFDFDVVEILKWIFGLLTGIFERTDDGILAWIFGKGAELIDENQDKITDALNKD